jgi:hypothetical protein
VIGWGWSLACTNTFFIEFSAFFSFLFGEAGDSPHTGSAQDYNDVNILSMLTNT